MVGARYDTADFMITDDRVEWPGSVVPLSDIMAVTQGTGGGLRVVGLWAVLLAALGLIWVAIVESPLGEIAEVIIELVVRYAEDAAYAVFAVIVWLPLAIFGYRKTKQMLGPDGAGVMNVALKDLTARHIPMKTRRDAQTVGMDIMRKVLAARKDTSHGGQSAT